MEYKIFRSVYAATIPANECAPTNLVTKDSEKGFKNYEKSSQCLYTYYYIRLRNPVFCCKKMTRAIK